MRTEAMRRLGDLQVEVDEAARAAGVDSGVEGLELKEAIALYEGYVEVASRLSAQRRGDVSAVARARGASEAGEGAGSARSAGREISAEPVVHRSAVPSRRNPVQREPLSRGRAGLQRRRQGRTRGRFLRAGLVQARLVAVQAKSRRGKRRVVPEGARSRPDPRRQAARARFAHAARARAQRRHAARHGDHVLRSRRSRDARCAAQAARQRSCLRAHAVRGARQPLHHQGTFPGRCVGVRGLGEAPSGRSLRAVAADAHDRGLPEGWLRVAGARRQAVVRGALRVRFGLLAVAHDCRCAGSRRSVEDHAEGSCRVLPREGAEGKEDRGLHRGGALVSRDAGLLPAGPRSPRDALPARRSPVRIATLRGGCARVRAHGVRLSAAREVCGGRLRSVDRLPETRTVVDRRVEEPVAPAVHRKLVDVRDQLPRAPGFGASVDEVGRRAVRAERVRSGHRDFEADPGAQSAGRARLSAHGDDAARALAVRSPALCRGRSRLRARGGFPRVERSRSSGDRGAHRGLDLQAGRGEEGCGRRSRRGRRLPAGRRARAELEGPRERGVRRRRHPDHQ